jgi:hypothetical protein
MRVALIVVAILMAATPSTASESCMSKAEARRHYGSVHIYWHGLDHCWDASPGRRQRHVVVRKVAPKPDPSKWRNAMSEMVPEASAPATPWLERWVDIKPIELPLVARWVDIPRAKQSPPHPPAEKMPISLLVVLLLALFTALTLAITEVLPGAIYRRQSG